MKNIITAVACVLVLGVFILQFTANQVTHNRMLFAENQVIAFAETAKQYGFLTEENIENLKTAIANKMNCDKGQIEVSGTSSPLERGEEITYEVKYPLKSVIGAGRILGIKDSENVSEQVLRGTVISEYVTW